MCGICGKLSFDPQAAVDPRLLASMMEAIHHRGPDDAGTYLSGPVALGQRRLSIIDLATGKQPISNEDGTIWIIFNGEIYNYKELQEFLRGKGHQLRTASDTEVIVHLYEELGEDAVARLQGMFAFALWDGRKRSLLLARDRVGIKPLYYCLTEHALLFGSELKAILIDPSVTAELEPEALDTFLTFQYVAGDQTPLKGIRKLSPGHLLVANGRDVRTKKYWDLSFSNSRFNQSLEQNVEELRSLLADTVRSHMISDVPVGILLSGGIDSTAVLSYATQCSSSQLNTFTIGFSENGAMDERRSAQEAAGQFGSRHFETTITANDFAEFLPKYVWHMEEPVCEPPAAALFYVTKLARQHVKVLLSGEGGDEAFAGYNTYRNIVGLEGWKSRLGILSRPVSGLLKFLGQLSGSYKLNRYSPLLGTPLEEYYYSRSSSPTDFFNRERANIQGEEAFLSTKGHRKLTESLFQSVVDADVLQKLLYVDTKTWLPDDLLIKADKITMANSVELRVPFLDHKILEFAASLPPHHKLNGREGKYILKRAIADRVPQSILQRPKTGFPVPYEGWIRKELKTFISDILLDRRTQQRGYFAPGVYEKLIAENSRHGTFPKEIFSLLVLELWHRAFLDKPSGISVDLPLENFSVSR
jgi:asparagine synthase (glutamine-hydrolysing)